MHSGISRAPFTVAALVGALMLVAGPVQGSNQTIKDCDAEKRDQRNLTDLYILKDTHSVSKVDHTSEGTAPASLQSRDSVPADVDARAPILYLTPRVTDLLDDVFIGAVAPDSDSDERPSSPVADSADDMDAGGRNVDNDAGADEEFLPAFQQEMFRKDI